ncbi:hypothetical protein GCM10022251_78980 [Phytohabitans flavus]|uniref:Uncharacterized protein n=1 Tax=Phytohabitans flavus TaxID=1076124 RepID=A0A6F8XLV4_9ACTN|nr:hypothetical protein Pflav_011790 [Phytohabitans flavus]
MQVISAADDLRPGLRRDGPRLHRVEENLRRAARVQLLRGPAQRHSPQSMRHATSLINPAGRTLPPAAGPVAVPGTSLARMRESIVAWRSTVTPTARPDRASRARR